MNAPEVLPAAHEVATLALGAIVPSKTNPRKRFDKLGMDELTASVQRHGVIQPVLVRPRASGGYELVSGERRYRAAKAAALAAIPALVRTLSDAEALELQVIENLQREDLHELEEAEGYEQLMKCVDAATGKPYDVDTIAAKVGKSRAYVYARLKLTALEAKAREAFFACKLNASTALLLARIPTRPLQLEALNDITGVRWRGADPMSFREASRHIHEKFMLRLTEAPFATGDAKLLPSAGACTGCPKRTDNQPELFADVKSGDVCTDPSCFAEKKALHFKRQREEALAAGRSVITGAKAKKILPSEHSIHIAESSGFVGLDAHCYDDTKHRTYAQILGKDAPPPTLVEHPSTGALIEVLQLTEIMQTLKGKGIGKRRSASSSSGASERAALAKARLEVKIRAAIFEAVHAAYDGQMSTADGALIAGEFFECTSHEFRKRIVELWSPPEAAPADAKAEKKGLSTDADWKRQQAFKKRIPTLGGPELARLLLDLALVGEVSNAHAYGATKAANLLATAERLGVDAARIRRELAAEAKPARTPKAKKPAAKKRAKPAAAAGAA